MSDPLGPLVVDARTCAHLIGLAYDTFKKLAAEHAWTRGDLPAPTAIGRGSGRQDRHGRRGVKRVWQLATIKRWLEHHEWSDQ